MLAGLWLAVELIAGAIVLRHVAVGGELMLAALVVVALAAYPAIRRRTGGQT